MCDRLDMLLYCCRDEQPSHKHIQGAYKLRSSTFMQIKETEMSDLSFTAPTVPYGLVLDLLPV